MIKLRLFISALLLSCTLVAQETYTEFHERIGRDNRLSQSDKRELIENMTGGPGTELYIDGEKFLVSTSPLWEYRGVLKFDDMLGRIEGLSMWSYVWGDKTSSSSHISYDWAVINDSLRMTEIWHANPMIPSPTAKDADRKVKMYSWVIYSADTIYNRIERLTGCEFTKIQANDSPNPFGSNLKVDLPLNNFTGVLYAKRANTAPRPEWTKGKEVEDFPEYQKWYNEPIYRLTFENGVLVSKTPMVEPIPVATVRRIVALSLVSIVVLALLLVIIFVVRDNRRKQKYLRMYETLQHNQIQLVNAQALVEESEGEQPLTREEVLAIYRDNFAICRRRFELDEWASRIRTMAVGVQPISLTFDERKRLSVALDECFIQVNVDLRCEGRLTRDDMRYCLLALLGCPPSVISSCIGCTVETLQTRKSRLKDKLPKDIFEWVFSIKK